MIGASPIPRQACVHLAGMLSLGLIAIENGAPVERYCQVQSSCCFHFLNVKGAELIKIHHQLMEVYEESCMDVKNVCKWCRDFTLGRTEIHDTQSSGYDQFQMK